MMSNLKSNKILLACCCRGRCCATFLLILNGKFIKKNFLKLIS